MEANLISAIGVDAPHTIIIITIIITTIITTIIITIIITINCITTIIIICST